MLKLIKPQRRGYIEISQSMGVKFSFLNKMDDETVNMIFTPVLCRDFLGDCLHAEKTNAKFSIYGFSYDPEKMKLDRDATRMSIEFPTAGAKNVFLSHLTWLHHLECENKLLATSVHETDDKHTLMVEGDPWWLDGTWRISLYTLLLRIMCYDIDFSKNVWEELERENKRRHESIPYEEITEVRHMNVYGISPEDMQKFLTNFKKHDLPFYGYEGNFTRQMCHDFTGIMSAIKNWKVK